MNKIIDILCNQVIDVALINKEANSKIDASNLTSYPQKFVDRINLIKKTCTDLYIKSDDGVYSLDDINYIMYFLMHVVSMFRNSYHENSYPYRVMNSLLDVIKESFIDINE